MSVSEWTMCCSAPVYVEEQNSAQLENCRQPGVKFGPLGNHACVCRRSFTACLILCGLDNKLDVFQAEADERETATLTFLSLVPTFTAKGRTL